MPIVRVEASIPPALTRERLLAAVADCVVRRLGVQPAQVRAALVALDPDAAMIGGETGTSAPPWIVAWVAMLEGRPEPVRTAFVDELLEVLAHGFGVGLPDVRVLVQTYPAVHWGMSRPSAAAKG